MTLKIIEIAWNIRMFDEGMLRTWLQFAIMICATLCSNTMSAQCSLNFFYNTDGIGNYLFSTNSQSDSTIRYYWLLNNDTLQAASNQSQIMLHLDTNGTYELCLRVIDSVANCSADTCIFFTEENAGYYPLLDSINIWHMFEDFCPVKRENEELISSHDCYCSMYYTDNDTVVDGIHYRNLRSTWFYPSLQGFIREDVIHRKVYFRFHEDNSEIILYDFSLQTGDSIPINFKYQSYLSGYYRLDSIKVATVSGFARRIFFLNQTTGTYPGNLVWIEGIGNPQIPFYPFRWNEEGCAYLQCPTIYNPIPYAESFVTCFEHEQRVFFDSCAYENALLNWCIQIDDPCNYYNICGAVEEIKSLNSFSIQPNPASGVFSFTLDVKKNDAFTISLININGKSLQEINLGKIQTGVFSKDVNIAALSPGVYFIECRTSSGSLFRKLIIQD